MILFIDTSSHNRIRLALIGSQSVLECSFESIARISESLSAAIQSFLGKHGKTMDDIAEIAIVTGPGSFMGSRTGVAYANALVLARDLPALGLEAKAVPENLLLLQDFSFKRSLISPTYAKPPNITLPKNKVFTAPE